ncbi:hypothetical protein CDL15_Pgr001136 [Punica granatum]|uniref:Uncharacterized protein n=1 Tax=Punica granatum TaxID=22663 RepID=A0A218WLX4_PUNGR|nr:hypothetical protein CDL15_Pgr001135 [Punica granatum]OWM73022.1 hypothetical protein CDL15_Pgr001136 [Punica granatum]
MSVPFAEWLCSPPLPFSPAVLLPFPPPDGGFYFSGRSAPPPRFSPAFHGRISLLDLAEVLSISFPTTWRFGIVSSRREVVDAGGCLKLHRRQIWWFGISIRLPHQRRPDCCSHAFLLSCFHRATPSANPELIRCLVGHAGLVCFGMLPAGLVDACCLDFWFDLVARLYDWFLALECSSRPPCFALISRSSSKPWNQMADFMDIRLDDPSPVYR